MVGSHLAPGGLLHPNNRCGLLRVKLTNIKENLQTFGVIFDEKVYHIFVRISGPPHDCYSLFFNTFRVLGYSCHLNIQIKSYHGRNSISVKRSELLLHLY